MEQHFSNLSKKKYEKIKGKYWVLVNENEKADPYCWVFSITKPKDLPNCNKIWRHPSYDEAIIRQIAYEMDYENFIKRCNLKIRIIK